jgi:putative tricarboxylic transport membrane protein
VTFEKGFSLKKYGDLLFACIMLFITIGYLILTLQIAPSGNIIDARFFPFIIDILMAVLTACLFVSSMKAIKNYKDDGAVAQKADGKTVLETVALIVVYVALMQPIGFVIATFLYLFGQFIVITPADKKVNYVQYVIIALISSVAVYMLFRYAGLNVMLPQGILTII